MATKNAVLITGASGWLASRVADSLLKDPSTPDAHLILTDLVQPRYDSSRVTVIQADLTDVNQIDALFATAHGVPDTVYCMHGIMSRQAEDNFDLGMKVNIDAVRNLLEAARRHGQLAGKTVKFIFTSGLAVYGGPLPPVVQPTTIPTPQSAYGTSKLISELLINEYTRRGFIDGRILRLPTVIVRPGSPAAATSAFLSAIIREPLKGEIAHCPIGNSLDSPETELRTWVASSKTIIQNLIIARHIPASKFVAHTRVVCLPGFTTTIREMLEALRDVGGPEALHRVVFKDDETDRRIVSSWPEKADNSYALELGFQQDEGGMVPVVQRFKDDVEAGLA
ncbi:NAD(P)-binding protein [Macrolepiota fuliginosa MF-IS2]|uniref:NAD(P)-binding protein n=1 Tax=Macrolepiota fuliginosa MF-IS2 TaxID=1400762 RepID=A0A9P5X8N1_9AGAR|nr:NAD(P)-binding protein [Macrolepiota fuliginosa MF-IS2]